MRRITDIIIHCSDTTTGNAASFRKYHMVKKGWNDIGYHFVVLQDGTVEKGRPLPIMGSHCRGANSRSIGICLVGKRTFPQVQMDSLTNLIKDLVKIYTSIKVIKGHRDYPSGKRQGKTCPNFEVSEYLKGAGLGEYV